MFEKESEEWLERYKFRVFDEGKCNDPNLYAWSALAIKECYIAGAEFGYNKANEWHYVKDELPKDGVQVLSEKGHLVIYKGDCFCWFEYSPNADNIKLRKWEEPIAWKEIVLPKESE